MSLCPVVNWKVLVLFVGILIVRISLLSVDNEVVAPLVNSALVALTVAVIGEEVLPLRVLRAEIPDAESKLEPPTFASIVILSVDSSIDCASSRRVNLESCSNSIAGSLQIIDLSNGGIITSNDIIQDISRSRT